MTLKDLLKCPWKDIAALNDKQLEELCKPYFLVSRPLEVAKRNQAESNSLASLMEKRASQTQAKSAKQTEADRRKSVYEEAKKRFAQLGLPLE